MIEKITLKLYGMSCASCAKAIEFALKKEAGILDIVINFSSEKAFISYDDEKIDVLKIIEIIKKTGYSASVELKEAEEEKKFKNFKIRLYIAIFSAILLFPLSMGHHIGFKYFEKLHHTKYIYEFILTTFIMICGYNFFKSGIGSLIKNRASNMDTLISLGSISAYVYSLVMLLNQRYEQIYFESSAYLITFIMIGKFFELKSKKLANKGIESILYLKPKKARVIKDNKELEIDSDMIKKGDIVIVKPGEKISVDGIIIEGSTSVDESFITGESFSVEKNKGEEVKAGSINLSGYIKIEAKVEGNKTFLDSVAHLVENTQSVKPPIQRYADKISYYFVPAVLVISFISFLYWYTNGYNFGFSLMIAVAVVVVACPCALGLAIPVAVAVGIGKIAKNSILIKDPSFFDNLRKITTAVFDKTGTLTYGTLEVENIISKDKDFFQILLSLELKSDHPVAKAIVEKLKDKYPLCEVENFTSTNGFGISGIIAGKKYYAGNRKFIDENKISLSEDILAEALKFEKEAKRVIFLCDSQKCFGIVSISDKIREDSKLIIDYLKKKGIKIVMITGDNFNASKTIAEKLGITEFYSEVLPEDKVKKILDMKEKGEKVLMIGDGVNDAAALKAANVSISFGNATDAAFENADAIILKNKLSEVITLFEFSYYISRKIRQNLIWAFGYNTITLPLAAGLFYKSFNLLLKPEISALLMSLSSISVVLNSLLIYRWKNKM